MHNHKSSGCRIQEIPNDHGPLETDLDFESLVCKKTISLMKKKENFQTLNVNEYLENIPSTPQS